MKIIVGLGNPDEKYNQTRHNVGWMCVDYLSKVYQIDINKSNHEALIGEGKIGDEKVILVKPTTYMNLSGNSVVKIKNWYKVDNKDILIIFDDIDIPFETFRYREKGSGGSHNGMKNIVQMLSSQDIPRIRIGLGGLKHEKQDMADFVLQRFKKDELNKLDDIFFDVREKVDEFIKQ